jgi:hypothetical protein
MTTCDDCKKTIWFYPINKEVIVSHTDRGNGRRDTQRRPVAQCIKCCAKEKSVEAVHDMTRKVFRFVGAHPLIIALAVIVILGVLSQYNTSVQSRTVAVTAFAPQATAPTPILIPPENRDAWRR